MRHLLGILISPVRTMKELAEERPLPPAAAVHCLAGLSWWYGMRWAVHWGGRWLFPSDEASCPAWTAANQIVLGVNPFALLILGPVLILLVWLLRTAVLHLVAEVFGGTGRALSLLATVGFSATPLILVAPLCAILAGVNGGALDANWPAACWRIVLPVLYLWVVALIATAIRQTHALTWRGAVSVLVAVALAMVVVHLLVWAGLAVSGLSPVDLFASF